MMRKVPVFLFAILVVLTVFTSCVSVNAKRPEVFSEEDASYALNQALRQSLNTSIEKLKGQLSSMDFIPQEYENLKNEMYNIPGMKTLINNYNLSMASTVDSSLSEFRYYVSDLIDTMDFENPVELVNSSYSSASKLFFDTYGDTIKKTVTAFFENADFSDLNSCIRQYNAYVTTRKNSLDKSADFIKMENYTSYLTNIIYDRFYRLMLSSEELFRTTPDPYADEITARVFGIN